MTLQEVMKALNYFCLMRHFEIKSLADSTEIDIFGQIGDSFFEEGNTLDSVKAEISNIKTDIVINIASLGGNAFEGLAIHDLIASHPFNTKINIVGATASAAAVIAMSGDEVGISENSLFLIHNSHTSALGNADDLEGVVNDMRKIDDRMVSVFTKKSGQSEEKVREIMKEDKFLSPEEAKELGFVTAISQPSKIAASINKNKIINSNLTKNQKTQILNTMDNSLVHQLKELTEKVTNFMTANKEVKIADEKEITNEISDISTKLESFGEENKTLSTENETLKTEVEAKTNEISALTEEIAKYKATPVAVEPKTDTEPTEEVETTKGVFGNTFKTRVNSRLTN